MVIIDFVILAVIVLAVFFALRHLFRRRKSGCSCCCAECSRPCGAAHRK